MMEGDLDHVVGMLHIKDFIRANRRGTFTSLNDQIVRELPVVPESTSAEDLLEQFKQGGAHAALVVDEFGATAGFVSLDDVIAEVMEDEDPELIERHDDGSITFAGEATMGELREHLDDDLFGDNSVVTIAGLVLREHGEVPTQGISLTHGAYRLTVDSLEGRKIQRVRVTPVEPPVDPEPDHH